MSEEDEEANQFSPHALSTEEITREFNKRVATLGGQSALAHEMYKLGDRRPSALRGIQRMAAGDTRVSGEMQVITALLTKGRRRAEYEAEHLDWHPIQNGCVTTKTRDFTITLSPETKGRWHVNLMYKNGYSPPWPTWQSSLADAKITAMLCLEDAVDQLRVIELDKRTASSTEA